METVKKANTLIKSEGNIMADKRENKPEKIIELVNLTRQFEDGMVAVDNVNLYVRKGEFVTFLGPSGCGKTTTLRMIAGFDKPTSGQILLNGQDISLLPPNKRPINTVFQRYALFPHLNVFDNIAFGLKPYHPFVSLLSVFKIFTSLSIFPIKK